MRHTIHDWLVLVGMMAGFGVAFGLVVYAHLPL